MDVYGIARLVKDIELRQTQSGISVANFSIAADRDHQSKEEKIPDFFECQAWRGTAEFLAKWFHKGDPIYIKNAELQTDKYQTKDGQNRTKTYLMVKEAKFVPGKRQDAAQTGAAPSEPAQSAPAGGGFVEVKEEELPF